MSLHIKSSLTSEFKVLLIFPFVFLFLFFITFNIVYLYIILPGFLLLFISHNRIEGFQQFQDKLDVVREVSTVRINEGNEIQVSLIIKNNTDYDSQLIELIDDLPDEFELTDSTNVFLFNIKKNEQIKLTYIIRCLQIGIYEFKSLLIKQSDVFGLLVENFELTPNPIKITVVPQFEKFERFPIFSYWMKYFNGYFISKEVGNDNDFRGIREYQYGDKLQRINWKTSSRYQLSKSNNIFSNIFNYDKAIEVELIIDLTYESFPIYAQNMRALTSLAEFLLRNRNKVGLTLAKQYPEHFITKMGTKHLKELVDSILLKEPDSEINLPIIFDRLVIISKQYHRKAILIVISSLLNKSILDYCKKLKKDGFTIIVIKPDIYEKQLGQVEVEMNKEKLPLNFPIFFNIVAFDFLVQNFDIKNKVLSKSIPLLDWNVSAPLKGVLNTYRNRIL